MTRLRTFHIIHWLALPFLLLGWLGTWLLGRLIPLLIKRSRLQDHYAEPPKKKQPIIPSRSEGRVIALYRDYAA